MEKHLVGLLFVVLTMVALIGIYRVETLVSAEHNHSFLSQDRGGTQEMFLGGAPNGTEPRGLRNLSATALSTEPTLGMGHGGLRNLSATALSTEPTLGMGQTIGQGGLYASSRAMYHSYMLGAPSSVERYNIASESRRLQVSMGAANETVSTILTPQTLSTNSELEPTSSIGMSAMPRRAPGGTGGSGGGIVSTWEQWLAEYYSEKSKEEGDFSELEAWWNGKYGGGGGGVYPPEIYKDFYEWAVPMGETPIMLIVALCLAFVFNKNYHRKNMSRERLEYRQSTVGVS